MSNIFNTPTPRKSNSDNYRRSKPRRRRFRWNHGRLRQRSQVIGKAGNNWRLIPVFNFQRYDLKPSSVAMSEVLA